MRASASRLIEDSAHKKRAGGKCGDEHRAQGEQVIERKENGACGSRGDDSHLVDDEKRASPDGYAATHKEEAIDQHAAGYKCQDKQHDVLGPHKGKQDDEQDDDGDRLVAERRFDVLEHRIGAHGGPRFRSIVGV